MAAFPAIGTDAGWRERAARLPIVGERAKRQSSAHGPLVGQGVRIPRGRLGAPPFSEAATPSPATNPSLPSDRRDHPALKKPTHSRWSGTERKPANAEVPAIVSKAPTRPPSRHDVAHARASRACAGGVAHHGARGGLPGCTRRRCSLFGPRHGLRVQAQPWPPRPGHNLHAVRGAVTCRRRRLGLRGRVGSTSRIRALPDSNHGESELRRRGAGPDDRPDVLPAASMTLATRGRPRRRQCLCAPV